MTTTTPLRWDPAQPPTEVAPEKLAALAELQREVRHAAPRRFRRKWRCSRHACDGMPHKGRDFKHARTDQLIPEEVDVSYLVGGRGSGKTWAGAHNFAQMVLDTEPEPGDDHTEWAVIAPVYRSARDVCIEGPSGLIRAFGGYERQGGLVAKWDRTYGHLVLTTGAFIHVDSADDGALRVQGLNLYGAWCDEIGLWKSWKRAWEESIGFAVRIGPARIICTGTPKLSSLAKFLLDDVTVWRKRLRTIDNIENLSKSFIDKVVARYQGTRLGQQELEGLLVDDVEGALWRRANIDEDRVHEHVVLEGPHAGDVYWERADGTQFRPPPFWLRVIVALDPADGEEDGDEQGIAVIGQSADDHELYVLHSDGLKVNPFEFLSEAVDLARAYMTSNLVSPVEIVMEKNHGGKYLLGLMDQVLKVKGVSVPYRAVDASQATGGKRTRAEDVSGLYERHKVHHVGTHADLEDQMCTFTGMGNEPSPDRMDALVWALKQFVKGGLDIPSEPVVRVFANADASGITGTVFVPRPPAVNGTRELPSIMW